MADQKKESIDLTDLVLGSLSPEERAQLPAFAPKEKEPPPEPPKDKGSYADLIPYAMGSAYGLAGKANPALGTALATLGGAAGEGYKQIVKHGTEVVPRFLGGGGAIEDVAGHLMNPETRKATYLGGVEGATQGRTDALKAGLTQGGLEAGGRGTAGALGLAGTGLKTINALPRPVKQYVANVAGALGGAAGFKSGHTIESALLGRILADPYTMKGAEKALGVASRGGPLYSQLMRAAGAYRNRPEPEE